MTKTKNRTLSGIVALSLMAATVQAQQADALERSDALKDCTIVGTEGDDWIIGSPHADVICGLGGDDTIDGGGGADIIRGGTGDNLIAGRSDAIELSPGDGKIVDLDSDDGTLTYGALQSAALIDGRIDATDLPASPETIVSVMDQKLCLSPADQGALYRSQDKRNEVMLAQGVDPLAVEMGSAASAAVESLGSPEVLGHTGLNGQAVLRVPDSFDHQAVGRLIEDALSRAPAVLAVKLLEIEASMKQNMSETELEAMGEWSRATELAAVDQAKPFVVEIWGRCTNPSEVADTVRQAEEALLDAPSEIHSFTVEVNSYTERVEVLAHSTPAVFAEHEQELLELLPKDVSLLQASVIEELSGAGRFNDGNPHWGGAAIKKSFSTSRCTSGFAMSLNINQRLMSTAGHCAKDANGGVTGWQFQSANKIAPIVNLGLFGTVPINALGSDNATSADILLIGASLVAYDRVVWVNEGFDHRSVTSRDRFLGGVVGSVCVSGAVTDADGPGPIRCSSNTSFTFTDVNLGSPFAHDEHVYTARRCATALNIGGDSGAAFWQSTGTGTIEINGSLVGGVSGPVDPHVCPQTGHVEHRSFFLSIAEVETRTGAYVETSAGSGVSW